MDAYLDRTVGTVATGDIPDTDSGSVLDGNGRPTGNPDATLPVARNRDFFGTTPRNFVVKGGLRIVRGRLSGSKWKKSTLQADLSFLKMIALKFFRLSRPDRET